MHIPLYRWCGEYVGFTDGRWFYEATGAYLAWQEPDGSVWNRDGHYLGQVVERHYVLRQEHAVVRSRRTPPVPPLPVNGVAASGKVAARQPRTGWIDALADLGGLPYGEAFVGLWQGPGVQIRFETSGDYEIADETQVLEAGRWRLVGSRLFFASSAGSSTAIYQITRFSKAAVTLLEWVEDTVSLPFELIRLP